MSISPNRKCIATGEAGKEPVVRVYNRDLEKYTSKLKGHRFEIVSVEWHPNGQFLASCGNVHDRQIIIWDTKGAGAAIATARIQNRLNTEPRQMSFYNKFLITIGKGLIRFWDTPQSSRSNMKTKAITGRNVALKTRDLQDAEFTDMAATSTGLFVVAYEGIGKLTTTRTLKSWCKMPGSTCIATLKNLLIVGIEKCDESRVLIMGSNFEQMNVFVPGGTPPIPVACRPFDQSHVIVVYKDKSCALMQIDENNEPRYIDELPAVNGAVSSIGKTVQLRS